jgi:hypothetical protein
MAPPKEMVEFDPNDGKKRVIITIDRDGQFEPVAWYGVAYGLAEASNIAAHGALILTECVWRESVAAMQTVQATEAALEMRATQAMANGD